MIKKLPKIVVLGFTAIYPRDEHALPPQKVWSVITKHYERATLHPDNLLYKVRQPSRVTTDQIFEIAYEEMIAELRHGLIERRNRPVPGYPFGYDWRQPLALVEAQLVEFVEEIIERTKLLRHYDVSHACSHYIKDIATINRRCS